MKASFLCLLGTCLVMFFIVSCDEEDKQCNASSVYNDSDGNDVIADETTGKVWLRCAMGQDWNGAKCTCDGVPSKYCLDEARVACPDGYKLPSEKDLDKLFCKPQYERSVKCPGDVYNSCAECQICSDLFGNDSSSYLADYVGNHTDGYYKMWGFDGCNWEDEYTDTSCQAGRTMKVRCVSE
jgi:hypothetical protein